MRANTNVLGEQSCASRHGMKSLIDWRTCLMACMCLACLYHAKSLAAQENSVFTRVRQLPDLGACPSSGDADPDLKKALSTALAEARRQAKNMVNLAQQAKDSGLLAADKTKELSQSAQAMDQALNSGGDCESAHEFAKLPAPGATTGTTQSGATPAAAAQTTATTGFICEHSTAPCINQPREGDTQISGKLALSEGVKLPEGSTAFLKVGEEQIPIDLKDSNVYKTDTGVFGVKVSAVNTYNTVQVVQKDLSGKTTTVGPVRVDKAQSMRDKISVDQASLDFGHQAMQTASDSKPVVVTNKTGSAQTFQLLTALGQARDFKVSGCQNALDNNDHCTFNVVFAPFPSNHSKVRESFIAVVPSGQIDAFDKLRATSSPRAPPQRRRRISGGVICGVGTTTLNVEIRFLTTRQSQQKLMWPILNGSYISANEKKSRMLRPIYVLSST